MNRMVYVVPEMLGIAIIDLLLVLATVAVISGCFCNVQHKHTKMDKYVHMHGTTKDKSSVQGLYRQ